MRIVILDGFVNLRSRGEVMNEEFKLEYYDFDLPKELIAQTPCEPRDSSRLLVLDKVGGGIEHKRFVDVLEFLRAGDVLVMNNSKVFPARLIGDVSGRKVEVFLLRMVKDGEVECEWQCFLGGLKGDKIGVSVALSDELMGEVVGRNDDGTWRLRFGLRYGDMMEVVERIGETPLPPYISNDSLGNKERYQTVFALEDKVGSVAAPTAGLHFTPELIERIKAKGVVVKYVTLHVGLGTFASVKVGDIREHEMHEEYVEVEGDVVREIEKAKSEDRRVIGVGTTSVRTLEFVFGLMSDDVVANGFRGWVNIFIYPGYEFRVIDGMITNFHIPKSSLMMLVSALAGRGNIMNAYKEAIREKYRFYSYGDACLIV